MEHKQHIVYMLKCNDGTLYTGYTIDLEKRIDKHTHGKGAKYTRGRGPFQVVLVEFYETKSEALKREHEIKKLTRKEKEKLISNG